MKPVIKTPFIGVVQRGKRFYAVNAATREELGPYDSADHARVTGVARLEAPYRKAARDGKQASK